MRSNDANVAICFSLNYERPGRVRTGLGAGLLGTRRLPLNVPHFDDLKRSSGCRVDGGLDSVQASLVAGEEDLESGALSGPEKLAILEAGPALISDSEHLVGGERVPQAVRKVLVEQGFHETGCSRSACANSIRRWI